MSEKKTEKANGTEGFFLALSSIGFIFYSYLLVKVPLEQSSILKILNILIWIIFCMLQIYPKQKIT
jgi:hypothetical protein